MFNITSIRIKNYLDRNISGLKNLFGDDSVKAFEEYYDQIPNLELKEIFSICHYQLNGLFSFINDKNRTNKHLNADPSRDLIFIIETLEKIQANLKESENGFKIDEYYESIISSCKSFLSSSGGSRIPENFSDITLIEIEPIFFLNETTEIQRSNMTVSFAIEEIGEGSYAKVYKYIDPYYNRPYAIKKAKTELTNRELKRFRREFEVLEQLNSPFIIEVYNYDEEKNQYTMEYVDETLEDYIKNKKLRIKEKVSLILDILKAFNYIHNQGFLHRDISYTNILIKHYDDLSIIKVSDFGLVKLEESNLTRRGTDFKGSLNDIRLYEIGFEHYQIRYETYALTRVINFILSGRTTISNYTSDKVLNFFSKGMHHDIEQRYSSVVDMAWAFNDIKSELD